MDYWFDRIRKKSPKPSKKKIHLGIPTNIATGPLGFQADLNIDPSGKESRRNSRVVLRDGNREDQPPAPEFSAPSEHGNDPPSDTRPPLPKATTSGSQYPPTPGEDTVSNGKGSRKGESSGPSKVVKDSAAKEVVVDTGEGKGGSSKPSKAMKNVVPEEGTVDTGEGESESSKPSRAVKSGWIKTALGGASIALDIASEASEAFGPLKAVLGIISTAYTHYDETVAVKDKIKALLSRIIVLEGLFVELPGNAAEERRRKELFRKLGDITKRLQSLREKSALRRFAEHAQDDEEISGLLEDLQEAISNYQIAQQIAIDKRGCDLMDAVEKGALNTFRCAQGGEYRHGSRKGCLKGTRRAVMNEIELWLSDFSKPPVYWLNGLAGTGKSTIAQTIAEKVFADGHLGASFFCSRDFEERSDLKFIFPTLAVQLARKYPKFRTILVPLIQSDPGIIGESLYHQMERLIVEPLTETGISTVIVIDALDECKDRQPSSAILSVLGQFVSQIPKVKFFLTGRPEQRIREGFRLPRMLEATAVFVLHKVEQSQVGSDIRLFFRHSFQEAADRGGLGDWPTEVQLDLLCERAAGLFVYAVATVKFVNHMNRVPQEQLDLLMLSPKNSVGEGRIELEDNTTLDSLYMTILQEAFGRDDLEGDPKIRSILGAVILAANPLSPSTVATLLGSSTEAVFRPLLSVQSLLILQDDFTHPVRPFHKSFPDFIVDPSRCTNRRFHLSRPDHHSEILIGCLELMNRKLDKNMCKIPDTMTNSEVANLKERAEGCIDPGLRYACESWYKHFVDARTAPTHTQRITSTLHRFLQKKFLFWLEVLSVLGNVRDAVDALEAAANWLEESSTLDLVNDYFRFVTGFFEVISISAPHIYHSALPLSPKKSIVRKLYEQYAHPLMKIAQGVPLSWDPIIATTKCSYPIWRTAWSSCSRFIAIREFDNTMGVQILDAVTFKRLGSFARKEGATQLFIVSTGSHLLTWLGRSSGAFISWDLQTGVPVSEIPIHEGRTAREARSITYSGSGTTFGVLFKGHDTAGIGIYNALSGTSAHYHSFEGSATDRIWTHDECIRFATLEPGCITIWEVGFISSRPPTEVVSLPTPDGFDPSKGFHFLPDLSRLAFPLEKAVLVWDIQHPKILLNSADVRAPGKMTFSPDGRFFACGTDGPEIHLWKESPTGYIPHRTLISSAGERSTPCEPLLSPNGQSIVVSDGSILQLWRTTDSTAATSCVPTQASQHTGRFVLAFSLDESLAAVVRLEEDTVTLLDLESGVPRLVLNAGMKIHGLRVAGATIVVVGDGEIVTWDLSPGDGVLNARARLNDSARRSRFDRSAPPKISSTSSAAISPDLSYFAIAEPATGLHIYEMSTGKHLAGSTESRGDLPWFTPDGDEVWCRSAAGGGEGWEIVKFGTGSHVTKLEYLDPTGGPPGGFPWRSPRGYKVTEDGWVLNSSKKRLLWLPTHWRSDETDTVWGKQWLALLHPELPEVVVLGLLE